jgi:hypothetical protein
MNVTCLHSIPTLLYSVFTLSVLMIICVDPKTSRMYLWCGQALGAMSVHNLIQAIERTSMNCEPALQVVNG